jgi:hypothetical protein
MPRICSFYGIAIYMYWDEAHHGRPHFHARYAGEVAVFAFDGDVIAGLLPRRAQALVRDWAALRTEQLEANWERARRGEPLEAVDPPA